MGEALIGGLLATGTMSPEEIAVVEVSAERRAVLAERFDGIAVLDSPVKATGVVIATKPADVVSAVEAAASTGMDRLLSIAAGVRVAALESAAGSGVPVVRAMPNTPALVGAGASAICGGTHATADDLDWAEAILGEVGTVVRVSEASLDAVTGLSGSGPAYVFLVAEAMIDAGVLNGLTRDTSSALVRQTLLGAATLLAESSDGPEVLRAAVTSPAGTTAAGLRVLEDRAVRAAFLDAVSAAAERSAELGS